MLLRMLMICLLLSVPSLAAEPMSIKVMSFNLRFATAKDGENHWDKRRELLLDTIRRAQPDLLGTQEMLALQRDYLAQNLDGYEAFGIGRDDGTERGEMTAILWKKDRFEKMAAGHFWLSETPDQNRQQKLGFESATDGDLDQIARSPPAEARPILWINTHFDHIGKTARLESAKLLRQQLQTLGKDCTLTVTGDFQCRRRFRTLSRALWGSCRANFARG